MSIQEMVTRPTPQPVPRVAASQAGHGLQTLLPSLATGGLLWLSFFPMAWGWLAWVALVPLLTLVRSAARPRTIYLSAWAGGLVFFWPALQWMRVADYRMYFTWAGLATYCSLSFPLAIFLIRWLDRRTRLPFVVTVPVVWTALEFFRSFFLGGFPWYLLAHSQHDYLNVIQIADITGAWGVSFLIAAVNAFLCEAYLAWRGRPIASLGGLIGGGAILAVALVATYTYGVTWLVPHRFMEGPTVALVQGNLPQYLRNNPTTAESIASHYITLCDVAARDNPDLIISPETSLPFLWVETWPDGFTDDTKTLCKDVARRFKTSVLLGINTISTGSDRVQRRYNSAALVDRHGGAAARYDKVHRVPFGEYVPLRDWLPFMNWFAPYDFDYSVSPGLAATRFPLEDNSKYASVNFGVVICYEDTDPDMARLYAGSDGKAPANFLVNISNDGWFEGTSEHEQHLAVCRFRAVECRKPIVRAVNMGISALIDSDGTVLAPRQIREEQVPSGVNDKPSVASIWRVGRGDGSLPLARWAEFKSVAGVILATIPLDGRTSFYARTGDWLPWMCWALLGAALVGLARRPDTSRGYRIASNGGGETNPKR